MEKFALVSGVCRKGSDACRISVAAWSAGERFAPGHKEPGTLFKSFSKQPMSSFLEGVSASLVKRQYLSPKPGDAVKFITVHLHINEHDSGFNTYDAVAVLMPDISAQDICMKVRTPFNVVSDTGPKAMLCFTGRAYVLTPEDAAGHGLYIPKGLMRSMFSEPFDRNFNVVVIGSNGSPYNKNPNYVSTSKGKVLVPPKMKRTVRSI